MFRVCKRRRKKNTVYIVTAAWNNGNRRGIRLDWANRVDIFHICTSTTLFIRRVSIQMAVYVCVCWITNEKPTIAIHCVSFESSMAATFILVYCHNASLFAAPFTQHAANAANQTVFNILVEVFLYRWPVLLASRVKCSELHYLW